MKKWPVFEEGQERCYRCADASGLIVPLENVRPSGCPPGSGALRGDCPRCKADGYAPTTFFDRATKETR